MFKFTFSKERPDLFEFVPPHQLQHRSWKYKDLAKTCEKAFTCMFDMQQNEQNMVMKENNE